MSQATTAPTTGAGTTAPTPAPALRVSDGQVSSGNTRRTLRRSLRPVLMLGGIAVVAIGALYYWKTGGRVISIDDAYVRAAKEVIATDVSGIVLDVPVHEGQYVNKGDVSAAAGSKAVPDRP